MITNNIISHNCVGARICQLKNMEYGNPFMWCIVPPNDFYYLYTHYNEINFKQIKLEKEKNDYKIVIDGKINVYYVHYKYDANANTPIKKYDIDVFYNKIEEYILEKYNKRVDRMTHSPIFVVTDREFYLMNRCNFQKKDLLKYINKDNCIVVTNDKSINGYNVIHTKSKKLTPNEIAEIIIKDEVFKHMEDNNTTIEDMKKNYKRTSDKPKNKKVVYTCISGKYDTLMDPIYVNNDFDYICYTDQPFNSNIWEIRPIPEELNYLSQVKKQRYIKVNAHKFLSDYELSVWVDASIVIRGDLNEYIEKNIHKEDGVMFVGQHPQRNCIYEEAKACISLKKDTSENINKQMERYRKEGFPKNYGLPQTGIIFRFHNNEGCKRLMEAWWDEIEKSSHRDQLSFNYALWKNSDVKIKYLDKSIFNSKWFSWDPSHKKPKLSKKNEIETIKSITKSKETTNEKQKQYEPIRGKNEFCINLPKAIFTDEITEKTSVNEPIEKHEKVPKIRKMQLENIAKRLNLEQ